jgi:hypothetical protein
MRRLLILAFALTAGPAAAQIPDLPPKTVAPVTVSPHVDPPKIVSSFPAAGAVVASGVLVMKITFDQKMDEHAFAVAPAPGGKAPDCLKAPRLLKDDKTFVLLCTTAPKTSYSLAFNAAPQGAAPQGAAPEGGFANIGGERAAPATLAFSTDDSGTGPRDVEAALRLANLTRDDMPIATQP